MREEFLSRHAYPLHGSPRSLQTTTNASYLFFKVEGDAGHALRTRTIVRGRRFFVEFITVVTDEVNLKDG